MSDRASLQVKTTKNKFTTRIQAWQLTPLYWPNRCDASAITSIHIILVKLSRRKSACRKDPDGTGIIYYNIDGKVNKCKKNCAVVIAVTESLLGDSVVSMNWEHGPFDIRLRHLPDIVVGSIEEHIHSTSSLLVDSTIMVRAVRAAAASKRRRESRCVR